MASPVPDALIRAAERLFAERGSDQVSLREITAEAGATNASAVQYHFGDRRGLIRAVLAKHDVDVERRRHALLDAYEEAGTADIRRLAHALVQPLADELGNEDGGPGYLQLLSDLFNRPNPPYEPAAAEDPTYSVNRWRALVMPMLTPEAIRLHRRFDALRFTVSELARRGRTGRKDHRLFTSQLVDLVTGLLLAPVSEDTRRLLR
ncbi:MAG TPA: helix-turn-helix domain-containing protein [Acidimicrobiales bacterium]|nr:helix-turn-helix domain-containing protein [Acidimicrobiales bacterium]